MQLHARGCAAESYHPVCVCVQVFAAILGISFQSATRQVQQSAQGQALAGRRQEEYVCHTSICDGEVRGDRAEEHPILDKAAKAWKYRVPHSNW